MRVNLVRRCLLLVLVLVGALSAVSAAEAATKPYSLTILPAPPATTAAAGTRVAFSATFSVPSTAQQALGSANVTPPAGFTLVSVAPTSAGTVVNGVAELRNLAVQPGSSLTVNVTADVGCSAPAKATWGVAAKQSNDFNGTGNDLTLVGDTPSTSVTGTCV